MAEQPNSTNYITPEGVKNILQQEAKAISQIPIGPQYAQAVQLIVEHVHQKGGRLVTSGMGKAGQIAANIATTFCSTGTPAYFLHPGEAQHGDLGLLSSNDLMLIISNSGKTQEILDLITLSRGLIPQLPYICITGNLQGQLAQKARVCLYTGNPAEVCPLGLTPTTSTTAMTVIGDVLVVATMQAIGFGFRDYALRHHGGYLGDKSRQQVKEED